MAVRTFCNHAPINLPDAYEAQSYRYAFSDFGGGEEA